MMSSRLPLLLLFVLGCCAVLLPRSSSAQVSAEEAVHVRVLSSQPEASVPRDAIVAAVARELALRSVDEAAQAGTRVEVRLDPSARLQVRLIVGDAGSVRIVQAPEQSSQLPEAVALLVGSMARNDAETLLSELASSGDAVATSEAPANEAVAPPTTAPSSASPSAEAQLSEESAAAEVRSPLGPVLAAHASVFPPVDFPGSAARRPVVLELGLGYSRVGAVEGVAISSGVVSSEQHMVGLQVAALGLHSGQESVGLRVAGVGSVGGSDFVGASVSGVLDYSQGEVWGLQVSGAFNGAMGGFRGMQVSGAFNLTDELRGLQLGVTNVAGDVYGSQWAVANVADELQGVQISLVNVAGHVTGSQVGLVNIASKVRGMQLGLVNVADEVQGASIGMVPYDARYGMQAVVWFSSTRPLNLGLRFRSGFLYLMPTFGADVSQQARDERTALAAGLSVGTRLDLPWGAFLDFDANLSDRTLSGRGPDAAVEATYRALVGVSLVPGLRIFAGAGARHRFRFDSAEDDSLAAEVSAGVELL